MAKQKQSGEAQGNQIAEKKEQKASISYALKAVTKHMETLRDAGLMHQAIYEQVMLELEASKREFVRREFGI